MEAFDVIVIIQGKIAEMTRKLNNTEDMRYFDADELKIRIDALEDILDTIGENMGVSL